MPLPFTLHREAARMTTIENEPAAKVGALRPRVWWCIVAALMLHVTVWVCWFKLASLHPVADVPLATSPHR